MSRVLARSSATSTVSRPVENTNDGTNRFNHIGPVLRILSVFVSTKQKNNIRLFWSKCRQVNSYKKKRQALICSFLNGLFIRKNKSNLVYALKKLISHRDSQITNQIEQLQAKKNIFKNKSAALIGIIYKKFYLKKMKNIFETLNSRTKMKFLLQNYKIRHIIRILSGIQNSKLQSGINALKNTKIEYLKFKNCLRRMERIFSIKRQYNISSAFCKLQICSVNKDSTESKVQKATSSVQNSRVKTINQRSNTRQSQPVQPQISTADDQIKRKQLEDKNRKMEEQIKNIKQSNQKIIQEYKKQINQYEAEHERLRFNSGILDGAIQELESQIINRQKKSRKGMSNAQLWDSIYSNFLLLLNQYSGQVLPKEKVLQSLQSPLVPLNIDIDAIKTQNQVLTDLLSQYRKFYEGTQIPQIKQEELMPYDILIAKNRFLYAAVETLIRQGLGTQEEIKQLQVDLQSVTKQNP